MKIPRTSVAILLGITISFLLASCEKNKEECLPGPDIGNIDVKLDFIDLVDSFASVASKDRLVSLLTRYPQMRDHFFHRKEFPNDSVFINELYKRFRHEAFDTLIMETRRVFGDRSGLRSEFASAFAHLKHYYPAFNLPQVQVVATGLDNDLLVSDTLIIIGIDFFLGKGAKYRPKMYEYLLRQYEKERIVPSCLMMMGIGEGFCNTDLNDKTILADMIAYGKAYYFAKKMLPCVPDSVFMRYTPSEMEGARQNEDLVWARLIEDEVIFSTSNMTKQRFLGERPITTEVGEKCPGRIAQWVGWEIVKKYAETHPEVNLPELMQDGDAQKIFKESRYRPI